jgi:hypothetical protein
MTQSTLVSFRLHEPEALADFLHVERTRLAPRAHFCRRCLMVVIAHRGDGNHVLRLAMQHVAISSRFLGVVLDF